jgi:hypothetical protein
MSFSPSVKEEVMIACARHCCVCHRYKGIKIEVHHLEQEANGGANSFDNAIPLCFDCHSDAGHYNEGHPRGTKFSHSELKKARDNWYEFVANNAIIEKRLISDDLQTNYFITHNFDIIEDIIIKKDLSTLSNFRKTIYIAENILFKLWGDILSSHLNDYGQNIDQTLMIEYRNFNTINDYTELYKNAEVIDKTHHDHTYFDAKREVSWDEIIDNVHPNSFIKILSYICPDANKICFSYLHRNGETCYGPRPLFNYTEYLEIAPISFVFLGITNVSNKPLKLNYATLSSLNEEGFSKRISLPNFNLMPYEMILLPVITCVNIDQGRSENVILQQYNKSRWQNICRELNESLSDSKDENFIGEFLLVESIVYNDNAGEYNVPVHKIDFNNLYSLSRGWSCGSCPHVFFVNSNGNLRYFREILIASSKRIGIDSLIIPKGIDKILICELETEVTYILDLKINDKLIFKDVKLCRGEELVVDVCENDRILIKGFYFPFFDAINSFNDYWHRNKLIENYIKHSSSMTNAFK